MLALKNEINDNGIAINPFISSSLILKSEEEKKEVGIKNFKQISPQKEIEQLYPSINSSYILTYHDNTFYNVFFSSDSSFSKQFLINDIEEILSFTKRLNLINQDQAYFLYFDGSSKPDPYNKFRVK